MYMCDIRHVVLCACCIGAIGSSYGTTTTEQVESEFFEHQKIAL